MSRSEYDAHAGLKKGAANPRGLSCTKWKEKRTRAPLILTLLVVDVLAVGAAVYRSFC